MRAIDSTDQRYGTGGRPPTGSALLMGHLVTLAVPALAVDRALLQIRADERWTILATSLSTTCYALPTLRIASNQD
ncbi:MAG: hypothetical protein ACRD1H_12075 [Vicinamibacterales bacterium]